MEEGAEEHEHFIRSETEPGTQQFSFSAWDSAPCEELAAEGHGHFTDSVGKQQSGGIEHSSFSPWDSASWEQTARSSNGAGKEWGKSLESSPRSPSFLQDDAEVAWSPFSNTGNEIDSECSDVDLDNDWVAERDSDSEFNMESLEHQKQSKWLRPFFDVLNKVAQTENERETILFYCPACRGSGLGETDLYKGLKPLITHAKNYTKRRLKLHKQFAFILEQDLREKNSPATLCVNPSLGKRLQIEDLELVDPQIVWPPMILIRTGGIKLEMQDKRLIMGTKHLREVLKDYSPKRVKHAHDPESHPGLLTLLVFQDSPVGYMHAKHLVKKFKCSGKGRKQWDEHVIRKSQTSCGEFMYGYMATAKDLVFFDDCNARKKKISWSLKSYKETIIQPLVDLSEARMKNGLLKAQLEDQVEHNKFLENALSKLSGNLELAEEEVHAVQMIESQMWNR